MSPLPTLSVVIPAHNEEASIGGCLEAVACSAERVGGSVEIIVVLNRCTDATERVAAGHGALIVGCDTRNLAAIRNAGAARAKGDILVTIDADSRMSPNALYDARKALVSGKVIGGGVPIHPERKSTGIVMTGLVIMAMCLTVGVPSAGMFWCYRRDFESLGGFDEARYAGEDVDFARRLRALGKKRGKRYGTLWRAPLTTSCRKFDQFGDWFTLRLLLCHPVASLRAFQGKDRDIAERYWYGVKR